MFFIKTIIHQPQRWMLTSLGIALCLILMIFLLGIYRGVSEGSVEYIRSSSADLWVLQHHANNILRSTSLMPAGTKSKLDQIEGIVSSSPVLFVLGSIKTRDDKEHTVYLTGFDTEEPGGGPPVVVEGRNVQRSGEIVLDQAFGSKNRIKLGDTVILKTDSLAVVGFSAKTNMIVIQYAFVSLDQAYKYLGFRGLTSCFLVELSPDASFVIIEGMIREKIKDSAVFGQQEFLENNTREMQSGLLPLLFLVALIGAVVLVAILSLILSVYVLERRRDYAVMKALGAPGSFIVKMVLAQSAALSVSGLILALLSLWPLTQLIAILAPEISIRITLFHLMTTSLFLLLIALLASVLPLMKLRKVYPLELFLS